MLAARAFEDELCRIRIPRARADFAMMEELI